MCNDNATVIIEPNEVLSTIIVENECSEYTIVVSGLGQQGVPGIIELITDGFGEDVEYDAETQTLTIDKYNWMDLARGYSVIPTLHNTTATGKIFKYIYTASTFYRYIATDLSIDAFYTTDSLSVELCRKKIII
jgi:hypothetical protein